MTENFYVFAQRPGAPRRPLLGPLPDRFVANEWLAAARRVGVARHYVSTHADRVFVGTAQGETRPGVLNDRKDELVAARRTVAVEV